MLLRVRTQSAGEKNMDIRTSGGEVLEIPIHREDKSVGAAATAAARRTHCTSRLSPAHLGYKLMSMSVRVCPFGHTMLMVKQHKANAHSAEHKCEERE